MTCRGHQSQRYCIDWHLLVHVDRFQSRRNERVFVTTTRVHEGLVGPSSHWRDVLHGVLGHVVLGGAKTHHRVLVGSRHWRLALLAVWVLELLRYTQQTGNLPHEIQTISWLQCLHNSLQLMWPTNYDVIWIISHLCYMRLCSHCAQFSVYETHRCPLAVPPPAQNIFVFKFGLAYSAH